MRFNYLRPLPHNNTPQSDIANFLTNIERNDKKMGY